MQINGSTQLFAIVGNPVRHSLSPAMHNAAFAALSINGVYVPIEALDIGETVKGLTSLGFIGASVTVPHKETVMQYLDDIDPTAKAIGAVNTLAFDRSSGVATRVRGFNTDWIGSNRALEDHITLQGSTALVLGAGGAAKAVAFGLIEAGARVYIANRTEEKAFRLADALNCKAVKLSEIGSITAEILINTTSVGMEPNDDQIPLQPDVLPGFTVVMDIVYAPLETRLLREAKACNCKVIDGLAMLKYQAVEQFRIWTGQEPPAAVMHQALLEGLQG